MQLIFLEIEMCVLMLLLRRGSEAGGEGKGEISSPGKLGTSLLADSQRDRLQGGQRGPPGGGQLGKPLSLSLLRRE